MSHSFQCCLKYFINFCSNKFFFFASTRISLIWHETELELCTEQKKNVDQTIKFFAKIAYRHNIDTNAQKIERKPLLNGSQIKLLILRNKDVCIHFLQLYNFETNFRFRFFHNFSISVSI